MIRICVLFTAFILGGELLSNDLINYYDGRLKLSDAQLDSLCQEIIASQPSDYLVSLAYYQTALLLRKNKRNFKAYETYDKSLNRLGKADTTDNYLEFSIRRNQGVILKQHWLISNAIQKYEEALPYAYRYSMKTALSVKYNLGRVLALQDAEKSLRVFLEILEEAQENDLKDREAKVYNEIALMFIRSEEYEGAFDYLEKALSIAQSKETQSITYQNHSHLYYEMKEFEKQAYWLKKSLEARKKEDSFISLMDLGECHIRQGSFELAKPVLREAEKYYPLQLLSRENIKVFEWLNLVYPDERYYLEKLASEYKKLSEENEKLETLLRQQAMQQLLLRLESDKQSKSQINLYKLLTIAGGVIALLILFTWRIWWYRLRKRLARKILDVVGKWDADDSQ